MLWFWGRSTSIWSRQSNDSRHPVRLAEQGIDVYGVRVLPDVAGENTIVVVPGANAEVGNGECDALDLHAGDVLVLQQEVPAAAVRAAARIGREAGCTVLLTPSPWRGLDAELFGDCDLLIVNEAEAEQLRATGYDLSRAVVTAGADGAKWGDLQVSGESVTPVDTTGSGDAFTDALAAALSAGTGRCAALELAVHAGSQAVLHEGAQPWPF